MTIERQNVPDKVVYRYSLLTGMLTRFPDNNAVATRLSQVPGVSNVIVHEAHDNIDFTFDPIYETGSTFNTIMNIVEGIYGTGPKHES